MMQPVLLSLTSTPDLGALEDAYPSFINDAFAALFLEDYEAAVFTVL